MSKDGGTAFPNITPDMNVDGGPGMSLRDYFAAAALQGMLATDLRGGVTSWVSDRLVDKCALRAYVMADAMLQAREIS